MPENTLLSHDLFEGIFARAGLVTDIELFEEFPTDYEVAAGPAPLGARRLAAAAVAHRGRRRGGADELAPAHRGVEDRRQPPADPLAADRVAPLVAAWLSARRSR